MRRWKRESRCRPKCRKNGHDDEREGEEEKATMILAEEEEKEERGMKIKTYEEEWEEE